MSRGMLAIERRLSRAGAVNATHGKVRAMPAQRFGLDMACDPGFTDVPLLRRLAVRGLDCHHAADVFGVTPRQAEWLFARHGVRPRGEQDRRRCLGWCERFFVSQSPTHRVCDPCKQQPRWRFAGGWP